MAAALTNLAGPGSSSPLGWAAAASVALHVAVLAGMPDLRTYSTIPATAPLNARIEPGAPPGAAPAPIAEEPPKPAPPRAERARKPAASPPAVRAAPSKPTDLPAVTEPAPASVPATAEPVAAAATPPTAGIGIATGEPTLAPRPGEDAPDLGSLAQYRLALMGAAKRHRLYPTQAVDRGWHGRVDVRLVLGADGALTRAEVRASSGHPLLDRQAVDMLRRAAELTPLPPALRNRDFTVDVPVVFELRGAG